MIKNKSAFTAEVLSTLILLAALASCVFVLAQVMSKGYVTIAGYSLFRVETGSMEPTIPTGALLICEKEKIEDIKLNDIICYRSQTQQMLGQVITHRVIKKDQTTDGVWFLETRGDANTVSDAYYVTAGNLIGKVVWYSGQTNVFANIIRFISQKTGFLSCIVLPVLVLSGIILRDSINDIRKEMRGLLIEETVAEESVTEASLSAEEYQEMVTRLKAEILEELTQSADKRQDNADKT